MRERVTATQIGWLVILILLREKHYLVKGGVYLWYPQGGDKVTTPLPYAAARKVKTKHGTSLAIAIDQENYFCAYKIFLNALFRYASIAFIKLIFMFL